jgi:hypothetical protein
LQRTVLERCGDDVADFRHAPHDGRDPLRRDHVDLSVKAGEQRLRHQRIANPVGRDDENPGH